MKVRYGIVQPEQVKPIDEIVEEIRNESSELEKIYNVDVLNLLFDFRDKNIIAFASDNLKEEVPNDLKFFNKFFSVDEYKNYILNADVEKFLDNVSSSFKAFDKDYLFDMLAPFRVYYNNFDLNKTIEGINYIKNIFVSEELKKEYEKILEIKNSIFDYVNELNDNNQFSLFFSDKIKNVYDKIKSEFSNAIEYFSNVDDGAVELLNEVNNIILDYVNYIGDEEISIDEFKSKVEYYFDVYFDRYKSGIDIDKLVSYLNYEFYKYGFNLYLTKNDIIVEDDNIKFSEEFLSKLESVKIYTLPNNKFVKRLNYKMFIDSDNLEEHIIDVMMEYIEENELDFCFLINDKSFSIDMIDEFELDNELLLNNLVVFMDKNLNVYGLVDKNYYDKYIMQKIIKEDNDEES